MSTESHLGRDPSPPAAPDGDGPRRTASGAPPVVWTRPESGWVGLELRELWDYRELLYFFAWSEVKVRYKQTVLGAAWAVLQPVLAMVVFSIFFGELAGIASEGVPYPVFAYSALVPWTYFANALGNASGSLLSYEGVITKVYFPRLVIPLSAVLSGLVDFAIAFLVLIGLMVAYGIRPTPAIWTLPLFVLFALATAVSVGLWLSALSVEYRDVRFVTPFLIQFWLFATPIAYPSSLVPEGLWRTLYGLNPMAGVVEGFRWALLGRADAPDVLLAVSVAVVAVLLAGGLLYFRRVEQTFADVV